MNRFRNIMVVLLLAVCLLPSQVRAQWNFDIFTVEAMIDDHKDIRSRLLARSTMEQANLLLHEASKASTQEYDSVAINLDKYQKCFDVIDMIYHGGMTIVNVYTTYNDVSDKINNVRKLLEDFTQACLLKGKLESSDMIIYNTFDNAIKKITKEINALAGDKGTLIELAGYATGVTHAKSDQIINLLRNVNQSLDNIRQIVDSAYFRLHRYITNRTHYWKGSLYRSKSLQTMCDDALSRWRQAGITVAGIGE